MSTDERFWSKVDKDGPVVRPDLGACWVWTGSRNEARGGYGCFFVGSRALSNRRCVGSHRMAWMLEHGGIPEGMMVLHRCDNPPCCNPNHLFLGTNADNMIDCSTKGRMGHARASGENHSQAKLSHRDVLQIRKQYADGKRSAELASEYAVHQSTIQRAVAGHSFRAIRALPEEIK